MHLITVEYIIPVTVTYTYSVLHMLMEHMHACIVNVGACDHD